MTNHTIRTTGFALLTPILAVVLLAPAGCGGSESESKTPASSEPGPSGGTSSLDALADDLGIEDEEPEVSEPEPVVIDQTDVAQEEPETEAPAEEEREWVAERESRSLLGRSRDKALNLRDQIQGSTSATLADTLEDEEYAASRGLVWDMPASWRMAVPASGRFAEMYIQNPLGNASVAFTNETESTRNLVRMLERRVIPTMGGRSRADTDDITVLDERVTMVKLEGTYIDPGAKGGAREQPFYAIRAAIIDLGEERIQIVMFGPQDTVEQNTRSFDSMVKEMSRR